MAKRTNTEFFGRELDKTETSGDYATYKHKLLPKSHIEFKTVLAHLNHRLEKAHKNPPPGVSLVNLTVFDRAYETAMRENVEDIKEVKCPKCKKVHQIVCMECGETHEIAVPSQQMEKNSIAVMLKLMDKLAPNLAAITQDININVLVQNIAEWGVKTITRYVPADERAEQIMNLNKVMTNVADADFAEVDNG